MNYLRKRFFEQFIKTENVKIYYDGMTNLIVLLEQKILI